MREILMHKQNLKIICKSKAKASVKGQRKEMKIPPAQSVTPSFYQIERAL